MQQANQQRGSCQENFSVRRPDQQFLVAFQGGAKQRLRRQEYDHVIQGVWKLAGVVPVRQSLDGRF